MRTFDVYLYEDADDDAMSFGSDRMLRDFSTDPQEAVQAARQAVLSGEWARAVVGTGEDVHEIYDTAHGFLDLAYEFDLALDDELPPAVPVGPRSRRSPLAERAVAVSAGACA